MLLGELLYRDADLQGAIGVYEQALAHTPGDPALSARLEAWKREAAVQAPIHHEIAVLAFADPDVFAEPVEHPPGCPEGAAVGTDHLFVFQRDLAIVISDNDQSPLRVTAEPGEQLVTVLELVVI